MGLTRRQSLVRMGAALGLPLAARPQDDQSTFKVDVNVVNLLAAVRDAKVRIVQNLNKEDFLLEEDETPRPGYRRNLMPSALSGEMPGSLFQLPGGGGIPWPGGRQRRPGGGRPRPSGRMAGAGTVLYDSVYLAADEVLQKQAGRKTILLISDGVEVGSKIDREKAIAAVQRADTIVYCVRYFDEDLYSKGRWAGRFESRGKEVLEGLSAETGGRLFEVTKNQTLEQIFSQIQEELRNQYSIGYAAPPSPDGEFRRVKLTTRDSGLRVQTRQGYYAKPRVFTE